MFKVVPSFELVACLRTTLNFKHETLNTALPPKCATQPVLHSIPIAWFKKKKPAIPACDGGITISKRKHQPAL
jgi:hypothetical protein